MLHLHMTFAELSRLGIQGIIMAAVTLCLYSPTHIVKGRFGEA